VVDSTRRSLILSAGASAAALITRRGFTLESNSGSQSAAVQALIDRERAKILETMKRDEIPGVAVCLLAQGKLAWMEEFGVIGQGSRRPIGPRTIFSIQSTSKNFTATAIMMAVQRGLLDLDQPITAYLPRFTVNSRFDSAPQEKITLRLLLSHRAGFTHEAPIGNNYDPAFPSFEAHIRSISDTWLRYPVGERYRYSNLGIDLAGYVLQQVMGKPFAACISEFIFDPLGMIDSTVDTEVYARRTDRALGHERGYEAVPLKTPLIPSGGVYTSARDMSAYLAFHLARGIHGGKTLLKTSLWNEMHGFSLGGDYGLGIIRTELRYGDTPIRMLGHKGGGFGFGCVCNYCPEAQLAWVALFNRPTSVPYQFGAELIDGLLVRQFGSRKPRMPSADVADIQLTAAGLQRFVGSYVGRSSQAQIAAGAGGLELRAGNAISKLHFVSPADLFIVDADGETVFYRYFPETQAEAAHLECAIGENSLDYNDGPADLPGSDAREWDEWLGRYEIDLWGKPTESVTIHRKNGYLYLNEHRLIIEPARGLFFTADGEALDFRSKAATWRNIRMRRHVK
jgi:CubicO group peptidase (beta-lactamase class C family)